MAGCAGPMKLLRFFFVFHALAIKKNKTKTPTQNTKMTRVWCALLLVTKYECVSLRPAWDLQPSLSIPWQGGLKMAEIPHIVGHAAILNPNQATGVQSY